MQFNVDMKETANRERKSRTSAYYTLIDFASTTATTRKRSKKYV
jgi:hypothetical protein